MTERIIPTFAERQKAWSSPPVDDVAYIPSEDLLAMDDLQFAQTIEQAAVNRYSGWRNPDDRWRRVLRMHQTAGKRILDYGCGIGIEALQYTASPDNRIWVADIVAANLNVAERVFSLTLNAKLEGTLLISGKSPFLTPPEPLDVIHCAGVLHHIPDAQDVVRQMAEWLVPGGELRLMVYSDRAWKKATGVQPDRSRPTHEHPDFGTFWTHWDPIGGYADWYDRPKLAELGVPHFDVTVYEPLTRFGEYVGAILVRR